MIRYHSLPIRSFPTVNGCGPSVPPKLSTKTTNTQSPRLSLPVGTLSERMAQTRRKHHFATPRAQVVEDFLLAKGVQAGEALEDGVDGVEGLHGEGGTISP